MSCHKYLFDIELLPSLDEDDDIFQQVILHLKQCPHCQDRYETARKLDEVLEAGLNALDPPDAFSCKIIGHIKYSLLPLLRKAILEAIRNTSINPSASWVHRQMQPQFSNASLRSICRNLTILKEEGYILEVDFGEGFKRFCGNPEPHCHFICQQCNGIYDIFQPAHKLIKLEEIQQLGYQVVETNLELRGICKKCGSA